MSFVTAARLVGLLNQSVEESKLKPLYYAIVQGKIPRTDGEFLKDLDEEQLADELEVLADSINRSNGEGRL